MPTVTAIANQATAVANLSARLFRTDFNAANNSALVGGTFSTLSNAVRSQFGGQPALNNLIESYRERREAFQEELRERTSTLNDSADRLREATRTNDTANEETTESVNPASAAVDNDQNTGAPLSTMLEFARGNIPPQERNLAVTRAESRNTTNDTDTATTTQPATNTALNAAIQNQLERTDTATETANATTNPNDEIAETATQNRNARAENPNQIVANNLNDFARNYLAADETAEAEDVAEINALARDTTENTRLNSVRNLVNDYNATVNYLNENRGISNSMANLARSMRNDAELTESLRNIGITINARGELRVDEARLTAALEENPDNVNSVLGSEGLTGRLERDIDRVNAQNDRLFTNIYDFANDRQEDNALSLYTNAATYSWENTGRLLSAMFS